MRMKVRAMLNRTIFVFLIFVTTVGIVPVAHAIAGIDGSRTVSSANTQLNRYAQVTGLTTNTITVSNIATLAKSYSGGSTLDYVNDALSSGDLVLVYQAQGATFTDSSDSETYGAFNYANAGHFEFAEVLYVSGNTIYLCNTLTNSYTVATGHVQVARVPQYTSLTVNTGASVVAAAWNGTVGGIVALNVSGTVTVNGQINVDSSGFRGGARNTAGANPGFTIYRSTNATQGAQKGESILGFATEYDAANGQYGRGAPANGGGGGDAHNASGGGGANGNNGGAWNGQGNPNTSTATWNCAWDLDDGTDNGTTNNSTCSPSSQGVIPAYFTGGAGGGRGGYTYGANNQNALICGPNNIGSFNNACRNSGVTGWGGDNRRQVGGLGGRPLSNNPTSSLFFGGGGGGGDNNSDGSNTGTNGAPGGGLILIDAASLAGAGILSANGGTVTDANNDGSGGGGGGGTIVVRTTNIPSVSLRLYAQGGAGGSQNLAGPESEGPGGGGGGGYIRLSTGTTFSTAPSVAGGANGTTNSSALTEFTPNGATQGYAGLYQAANFAFPGAQQCASDMSPTFSNLPTALGAGQTVTGLTLICTNAGPNSAIGATCAPGADAGTISSLSCTPTPPTTVAASSSIACTFTYTAPGTAGGTDTSAQTVTLTGTTGAINDSNGGTGTGGNNTTTSTPKALIDAVDDSLGPINSSTGGSTTSVLVNDTNGAATATPANVTITNLAGSTFPAGGSALSVDPANGTIIVPASATPGTYTVPYQICAKPATTPPACDTATATVTVNVSIDAVNDSLAMPTTGGTTASVVTNDTTNGSPVTLGTNATLTPGTAPTPSAGSITMNADGTITVASGTTPGTYSYSYTICTFPATTPATCDTATATVTVASIHAQNDTFAVSPDVATGATTASVVANDTVNGAPVTLGTNATLYSSGTAHNGTTTLGLSSTPAQGGITMNADGTIHVAPNTTQGTYNYVYEICVLPATTPAICATGTATITVNATVPITLASVDARQGPSGLSVAWTTATETRNAGFHLYGRMTGASDWLPLTAVLVPSQVIDSLEPQRYTATFPGVAVDELLIEDWDTQGQTQRHGPFAVGRQHGFDAVAAAKSLDWATIHAENAQTTRQIQEKALSSATNVAGAPDALLWVTEPGVQRVSFDELQAAGARFSGVAIADLALTDAGKKYPRYVIDGNGNGQFDSGDSVEFLGEVTSTLYSARNAYRLLVDRSRVNEANSKALDLKNAVSGVFNDEIKVEQQRVYSFAAPGSDPWYDQWLFAYTSPVSLERTFDLPGYAGGEARLTLRHWGVTDWPGDAPDHHLIVKVNGQQLDEAWFDGSVDASRTLVLPQGLAQATGNTLTLIAPGDTGYQYDIQALDNFSVQYPRHTQAYEGAWRGEPSSDAKTLITGFQGESVAWRNAQRRIGAEQLVVNGQGPWIAADSRAIHHPTLQVDIPTPVAEPTAKAVDYLIISHPLFVDSSAMTDLVALQQGRGYRTAVVDVDTIYAAYSDFEVSADAISRYLKQAKPRFALLVGGDSYDYHDYLKLASQSFMPTHYAQTVAPVTYAPADGQYVDYNNDGKPQAALGRLPARTVAELTQVVAKIKDHVPPTHAVLGAGPSDGGSHQFAAISEGYAAQLPSTWTRQLVAVDDLGLTDAKTTLKTELNQGDALVSYMGHSSYAMWGLNASGILLSATEARQLSNATPLLVTQWGCWNTYFVNPKQDTMANAFLFQSHGAVAVLGATALSDINVLSGLGNAFFKQLGQSTTLGEALQAAQRTYLNQNPAAASKLRGFALLGDPAAEVR